MKTETFSRYLVTLWLRRNLRPVRINWDTVGKPQPSYNEMMRNAAKKKSETTA